MAVVTVSAIKTDDPLRRLRCVLSGSGRTSRDVTASVIPATGVPGALPAPQTPAPCHATVGDGGLTVLVNDYPDGAAVSFDVTLTP